MNLAHKYCASIGTTVAVAREDFFGSCIDFAGDFVETVPGARLAYFDNISHPVWKYHAAVVIDEVVHDLWSDRPIPLKEFMEIIGAESVEYPAEERDAIWN